MSAPISNFGFSRNNLTIDFKNLSFNIEPGTTYIWDFGNGTTSTTKDPSVIYTTEGFFNVSLTVTNGADSDNITMAVGVGSIPTVLNISVLELTYYYLPSTLLINNGKLVTFIQTWQVYLQPLIESPLVSLNNTHNELMWGALSNKLIALLSARDMIRAELTAYLANLANEGSSSHSTTTTGSTTERSIKSIETGPVKTEWYEGSDSNQNSEVIKNIGESFKNATGPSGIIAQLDNAICQLSKRLGIYLPECGKLPSPVLSFVVGNTPCVGSILNTNPNMYEMDWELNIYFI